MSLVPIYFLIFVGAVYSQGVNGDFALNITNLHNQLRSMVAQGKFSVDENRTFFPTATNMLKMRWSEPLARHAERFARTCPSEHSKGKDYGENIITITNTEDLSALDLAREATMKWFNEFKEKFWNTDSMVFHSKDHQQKFGHATQMIWQSTKVLGCGVNKYNETTYWLVCRYKPRGNMEAGSIYEVGEIGTQCPKGTYCSSGLCQKPTKYVKGT